MEVGQGNRMRTCATALTVSLLLATAARAQPACPAPSEIAGANVALVSATASPELEPARLALDQAATVTLHPVGEVRFVTAPQKRGDASSFGGMLAVDVREAGTYQVALSAGANPDKTATVNATLQVTSVEQLSRVLARLESVRDVFSVHRDGR